MSDVLQQLSDQLDLIDQAIESAQAVYDSSSLEDSNNSESLELAVRMHALKDRYEELRSVINTDVINKVKWTAEPVQIGDRTVEIKGGKPRKAWDHVSLKAAVSSRIRDMAVDFDTGEVLLSEAEMIEKVLDTVGISYWKVGALGDLGINVDNYCETGESKVSLIVRKK